MKDSPSLRVLEDGLSGLDELLEVGDEGKDAALGPPRSSGLFDRLQLLLHEPIEVALHLLTKKFTIVSRGCQFFIEVPLSTNSFL